ncbi:LysR family transcriptional regulator [Teichococcus aestuarii]|uniref:LysR family transcriptional regulator n=1 Tax=Teichococcus aestuarii TaxID=568898 RepID=UPI00361272D0
MGRAAAELGRTHGAVSRQIRALQEAAGVPLFDRAGTGIRLNAQGEALRRRWPGRWMRWRRAGAPCWRRRTAPRCTWRAAPPSPCAGWCRGWAGSTARIRACGCGFP